MPSIINPRNALALSAWRDQKQKRQSSSAQELRSLHDNERTSAILHGKPKGSGSGKKPEGLSPSNSSPGHPSNRPKPTSKTAAHSLLSRQRQQTKQQPSSSQSTKSGKRKAETPISQQTKQQPSSSQSTKIRQRKAVVSVKQQTKQQPSSSQSMISRKRKAEVSVSQQPARRRRRNEGTALSQLKDEAYIRKTMHIPTPQEYPNVPLNFFKNIKGHFHDTVASLAELQSDVTLIANDVHQCTLRFKSAAHEEVVVGEGRAKRAADQAAHLHLVAKLHEQGVLADILDRNSTMNQMNKASIVKAKKEERSAIMDIYNYAARIETVPRISSQVVTRNERGRTKRYVRVTVELLEQNIRVVALGPEAEDAESRAALLFKKEAERYHATQGSDAIVIKDSGALTTDTASKYLEFYKIVRPGVDIRSEAEQGNQFKTIGRVPHRVQVKMDGKPLGEPVVMQYRKMAEETASLTAAIALKKLEPDLYPRYLRALSSGNGQILKPLSPVTMPVHEDCSLVMRETLLGARRAGLPDEVDELASDIDISEVQRGAFRRKLSAEAAKRRDEALQRKMRAYLEDPKFNDLRNQKSGLPMNQYRAKVLDLVNNNVYSIIVGSTGSGKTTQVPQILLDNAITKGRGSACNIICTQPRRIAATSVARRVANERTENLQESVGYHVRFDAKLPRMSGSITYCTTGILQQQLQHMPDVVMDQISHLVIDEVHERDILIDFLLILLKKSITIRLAQGKPVPQVVLMSATMDTELFASYFKSEVEGQGLVECPSLSVPGRTFPVREKHLDEVITEMRAASPVSSLQVMYADPDSKEFLEAEDRFRVANPVTSDQQASNAARDEVSVIDWKRESRISDDGVISISDSKDNSIVPFGLIACTIAHIAKTSQEGAILAFLPGLAEIVRVQELLSSPNLGVNFDDESKFKVILLHSSIAASQNTVFEPVPEGCRKIILATNIAETSITIPDVQYVVDSGKLREKQYDQARRISQLVCTWISKSNAKQRAGRAGRVQNGNYYALYTKQRYETLRAIGLPELLRTDLQDICLRIKAQAFKTPIREFLADAIEPPSAKAVDSSVINLQALDAITDAEAITPLGRLLSSLPVHPSLGKMIVLGIIFRCLDPMLVLGAASEERSLFISPLEARRESQGVKLSFVEGSGSDHIALLNAVRDLRRVRDEEGEQAVRTFAHRHFLHYNAFKTIDATAKEIEGLLIDAGLIPYTGSNYSWHSNYEAPIRYGDESLNENSHKVPLIKALALAGFHPNLAVNTGGGRAFRTPGERNVIMHPSSVNAPRDRKERTAEWGALYTYSTLARSNDGNIIYLRETTLSTPLMAMLFGGKLRRNNERGNIIEIDNWLPFYVSSSDSRTAKTIIEFRKALERLLITAFHDLGKLSQANSSRDRSRRFGELPALVNGGTNSKEIESSRRQYFADDKVREIFADGLVDVLDRDVRTAEAVATKGWGGAGGAGEKDVDSSVRDEGRRRSQVGGNDSGGRGWGGNRDRSQGKMRDLMRNP